MRHCAIPRIEQGLPAPIVFAPERRYHEGDSNLEQTGSNVRQKYGGDPMSTIYRSIRKAVSGKSIATGKTCKAKTQRGIPAALASMAAAVTLVGAPGAAQAALVSVCTGVSLPPSTITTMLNPLVTPLATALPLLGLGPIWAGIAAGAPVRLNVLDTNGDPVLSTAVCDATADSYALNTPKGISIGGNKITGLGITTVANAGETDSVALGNGATTNPAATNSVALGTNASVGAVGANSVALGAGSAANIGAQSAYPAFGLATLSTSVGEVSVGSAGSSLRKITNVAPGSALTDAVNVEQLQAAIMVARDDDNHHRDHNGHQDDRDHNGHQDDRDQHGHQDSRDHYGNRDDLEHEISALMQQVRGLQDQVVALQTQLTDMHTQLASIEAIAPHVSLKAVNGHDAARFSSANLQAVNGVGSTASANGLGNMIIGYDEADTSGLYHCTIGTNPATQTPVANETDCVAAGGEWLNTGFKTGSHYLVLGMQNNYSRWGGLITGTYNTSNFDFASVSGGHHNTASGSYSSITGTGATTIGSSATGAGANTTSGNGTGANTTSGNGSSATGTGGNTASGNASNVTGAGGNTTIGFD